MTEKKKAAKPARDDKAAKLKRAAAKTRQIGDSIFVRDFIVDCNVGVYAEEQGVTQRVRFTVDARLARDVFTVDDNMADVPSYADIIDFIVALARAGHINLVETFAERIAEHVLSDKRIIAVRVMLEKLERGPLRGVEIIRPATRDAAREFGRG
ncbi:Dihydroneopterin aldolase [Hyphomicrobium sp. GJ21]|uniref:dihydroneopterin aldolase n=1 Tax=Hyphomicrobium denitrificans (strain ATCC 51888 / DSM 1869 / NCIMB 11706 / TK 0415) TaxID=582899 RepID=D8JXS0_HYPDA|nr:MULTISPECIES: dihydroneopterin aldolase [Hyphomicrobium]ADJ23279.1 dihydroneopterin aldolase [Hyphomicrobium denitrificans ATCC 51888]CEJ85252.1 Dihydroneopterin aldolase [Hyphomicrobium sp. GJ21]